MTKYLAAYAATASVIIALDLLFLGVIAKSFYQQGIGHLMADRVNVPVAALFYAIFAFGLMMFVVVPNASGTDWGKTLIAAALFGFISYATYDLTNLATLKNWPISVALVDMVWGTLVSVIAAAAGKTALDRIAAG